MKYLLISFTCTFFTFCTISLLSVIIPILPFFEMERTSMSIGFPFPYYSQFWLKNATFPNFGWNIKSFILDLLITWLVVQLMLFFLKRK